MLIGLVVACVCLLFALLFLIMLLSAKAANRRMSSDLQRFKEITSLEEYAGKLKVEAETATKTIERSQSMLKQLEDQVAEKQASFATQEKTLAEHQERLNTMAAMAGAYQSLEAIRKEVDTLKDTANQYNHVIGNFKTAGELKSHIKEQRNRIEAFQEIIGKFEAIAELDQVMERRLAEKASLENRVKECGALLNGVTSMTGFREAIRTHEATLGALKSQIAQVEEASVMQEFGFYQPRYNFDSSSIYEAKLDQIRERQTYCVKNEIAVRWEKQWSVEGSEAKGKKMMAEQTKLMLRAFNGECDAAVAKVKYNNATSLESRITRSHEQINKLGKTNASAITDEFLRLKLEELHLVHEHRVKQQQEKEEQQEIRDRMREEEKAQREFEEAEEKASKEAAAKEKALEKAERALEFATRSQVEANEETKAQNTLLAVQVEKLKNELSEAIDRKAKAIARAQLTKSGYVYVLSNIGSFGKDLYKLGLTRRLDPLERVRELGDASVPFPFDVHAVFYSENAPELENKLHKHFADRRVNLINHRREYFHVTLEEIMVAVKLHFGEITYITMPEAAEYRETLAKRKASSGTVVAEVQVSTAAESTGGEARWGPRLVSAE